MASLLDTNILLRLAQPQHPLHALVSDAIDRLTKAGDDARLAALMRVHRV